jgi:hypothetical protein
MSTHAILLCDYGCRIERSISVMSWKWVLMPPTTSCWSLWAM